MKHKTYVKVINQARTQGTVMFLHSAVTSVPRHWGDVVPHGR